LAKATSPHILSLLEKLDGCKHLPILNLLGYTLLLKPKLNIAKKNDLIKKMKWLASCCKVPLFLVHTKTLDFEITCYPLDGMVFQMKMSNMKEPNHQHQANNAFTARIPYKHTLSMLALSQYCPLMKAA
jgi:hypothetical protein